MTATEQLKHFQDVHYVIVVLYHLRPCYVNTQIFHGYNSCICNSSNQTCMTVSFHRPQLCAKLTFSPRPTPTKYVKAKIWQYETQHPSTTHLWHAQIQPEYRPMHNPHMSHSVTD